MSSSPTFLVHLVSIFVGVTAHLGLFIRGEWHLSAPNVVLAHLALVSLGFFAYTEACSQQSTFTALLFSSSVLLSYAAGLYGSIAVYRLFFHRLRHFPGPRMAALTKLWHVYQCRDSRNHLVLDSLHKKYGDFVRTGPEEITIFSPEAFEAMDGASNRNTRSDWYDIVHPRISPIFSREERDHRQRRKVWNQALSTKSIKTYLPRILSQITKLQQAIERFEKNVVPVNDVMQWFAFDSMGEFAFNHSFNMLETAKWHDAAIQQRSALMILGAFNPTVWAIRLAFFFGSSFWRVKDWFGMVKFCDSCIKKRLETEVDQADMATWFIREFESGLYPDSPVLRQNLLSGNALSVIVGGSDTTGPSLMILWYFLALYPEHAEKIREELRSIDTSDVDALSTLPHLNGFINESMRLLPAALTMGTRVTPSEGLVIGDTFIPGNVKIAAPRYSIFRSESAFEDALSFIPERWYDRPQMIKNKQAFAPFGVGRRACVGQNLALTQIRLVAAKLLLKFHVRFPMGMDKEAVIRDMRDQMTARPGQFGMFFDPIGKEN
ncbi:putative cytochrome P450 [Rosellinia necatrix]|uniref:Putative cytochrome P450 n=1 Tax=Rosellinia necatrix TaxID=77044 RepID=A0A1W2TRK0_ROSNE|nr:putative cytochrome P450 [Rosellinia necatrix]